LGIFKPNSKDKGKPEVSLTPRQQAERYEQRGEYYKAISAFESLLTEEKDRGAIFNVLGDLYEKLGNAKLAVEQYEFAIAEYTEQRQYRNAIGIARKVLRSHKNRFEMYKRLADLYAQEGRTGDAIQALNQYAEHMKGSRSAHVLEEIKNTIAQLKEKSLLVQSAVDLGREEEAGIFLPPIGDTFTPRPRHVAESKQEVTRRVEEEQEAEQRAEEARRVEQERLVKELEQEIIIEQNGADETSGEPFRAVQADR
jgi:tetratricopeptide (TPR) repeat protein